MPLGCFAKGEPMETVAERKVLSKGFPEQKTRQWGGGGVFADKGLYVQRQLIGLKPVCLLLQQVVLAVLLTRLCLLCRACPDQLCCCEGVRGSEGDMDEDGVAFVKQEVEPEGVESAVQAPDPQALALSLATEFTETQQTRKSKRQAARNRIARVSKVLCQRSGRLVGECVLSSL